MVTIMLPFTNYAPYYASIIGKALVNTWSGQLLNKAENGGNCHCFYSLLSFSSVATFYNEKITKTVFSSEADVEAKQIHLPVQWEDWEQIIAGVLFLDRAWDNQNLLDLCRLLVPKLLVSHGQGLKKI